MKQREWTTIDKSEWGPGAWQDECDKMQFEAHGLPCLVHRNDFGAWCGYVGVAEGHPYFQKGYDDVPVEAHGGLTFADFCADTTDESHGICHVPDEGEPHRVWWLGFDCAHAYDFVPGYGATLPSSLLNDMTRGATYRDLRYVVAQVISLAEQLRKLSVPA